VKARDVSTRIHAGEDVPIDEALDVECLSTHAAASNLLCEAHDRDDPLVFSEAQLRAEAIAGMLDQTVDAYGDGESQRMRELRDDVGSRSSVRRAGSRLGRPPRTRLSRPIWPPPIRTP
jgi:hypothetical protein